MSDERRAPSNPFRGLTPFQEGDELFGRDRDLVVFEDRLYSARTTLLFAASGVGKSSFLNAKVAPSLRHDHFVVRHARWGVRAPLEGLRSSWIAALAEHLSTREPLRRSVLPDDPRTPEALRAALERLSAECRSLLDFARRFAALDTVLLLDQFEEPLNSLVHDPAVDALVGALSELINDSKLPLRVVFSMRQEFLAELSLFENRVPDLFANYYNLRHPTPEQAEVIISATVAARGAAYDERGVSALVQDLLLVGGLQPAAGSSGETRPLRFVVPPVLQIVCNRMWNRDAAQAPAGEYTFASGYAGGQAHEIVQGFVEELIAKLDDAQRVSLSKSLDFLVSRQGGKVAYEVGVLADHLRCKRDELDAALNVLATEPDRVFRRIDHPDKTTWYELYHDVYAGAMTAWKARFDAERARLAQERARAESKKSSRQTAAGCAAAALLMAVIGTCSTAWDAREHRRALVEAGDDYNKARTAYEAIEGNVLKTLFGFYDADQRLAEFWDRRADAAKLTASREHALVYALEALATKDSTERRRLVSECVGEDLSEIVATYRTSDPIVALSRDGERYATLGRGGVVVSSVEKRGAAALTLPRVEFVDVLLSQDGNAVWAIGKRAVEGKGNPYEQKAQMNAGGESEFGLWTRRLDAPDDAPRGWVGVSEFGAAPPAAWSISAQGNAAVCAWRREPNGAAVVFDRDGRHELAREARLTLPDFDPTVSKTGAWEIAARTDASAFAFPADGHAVVEAAPGGPPKTLATLDSAPRVLRYSPDGGLLAVGTQGGELEVIHLGANARRQVLETPATADVVDIAFDAEGRRVYAQREWTFEVWNVESGKREGQYVDVFAEIQPLSIERDAFTRWGYAEGPTFLTRVSADLTRLLWSRFELGAAENSVSAFAPRAGVEQCSAVLGQRTLRVFASKVVPSTASWWNGQVIVEHAPDGVNAYATNFVKRAWFDVATGAERPLPPGLDAFNHEELADFDPSGQPVIFGVDEQRIRDSLGHEFALPAPSKSVSSVFYVDDFRAWFVAADKSVSLVPVGTGAASRELARTQGFIQRVAHNPARSHVAYVEVLDSGSAVVRVLAMPSGDAVGVPIRSESAVISLAVDSGGRRLALAEHVAASDAESVAVRVCDVATGQEVAPGAVDLHTNVVSFAFAPDGSALVARTLNALVRVPLGESSEPPRVRFLRRGSIVTESTPNWFDADDPRGERPRVLVLDAAGRLVLERVRFDDTDLPPIVGDAQALRADWQRILDLQLDGDGRVVPRSGTTGGAF